MRNSIMDIYIIPLGLKCVTIQPRGERETIAYAEKEGTIRVWDYRTNRFIACPYSLSVHQQKRVRKHATSTS